MSWLLIIVNPLGTAESIQCWCLELTDLLLCRSKLFFPFEVSPDSSPDCARSFAVLATSNDISKVEKSSSLLTNPWTVILLCDNGVGGEGDGLDLFFNWFDWSKKDDVLENMFENSSEVILNVVSILALIEWLPSGAPFFPGCLCPIFCRGMTAFVIRNIIAHNPILFKISLSSENK